MRDDGRVHELVSFDSTEAFGVALTALKQRAGVSLRQLSTASGLGFSTINGYCRGRHLPQAGVGEQFRLLLGAVGVTADEDHAAWLSAVDDLRRAKTPAGSTENPYPGLRPFDVGDDRFFHGRGHLVESLVGLMTRDRAEHPVAVVGPSGAGKSSLLRAGLISALSARWTPLLLTPGKTPMRALTDALAEVSEDTRSAWRGGDPAELSSVRFARSPLVLVDQLEEVFAAEVDPTERDRFLESLAVLACRSDVPGRVLVVLGLRADFYDRALRVPHLTESLRTAQLLVPAMNADELRQAIAEPIRAVGREVEGAVVERLMGELAPRESGRDAAHEPGALPLLGHVLHEAFELSGGARVLGLEHYDRTGGVVGSIARTAEAAYAKLSEYQRRVARSLLLRMVHVGDATAQTRRRLSMDEITGWSDTELEDVAEVLDTFIAHRLVTADADSVEISHEALLGHWPRLREWIDEAADRMRVHQRLADNTRSWLAHERDPGELARGTRLDVLRSLVEDEGADGVLISAEERAFVAASVRGTRSRHRRLRALAIAMTVLALLTTAFAGLFAVARQEAATARDEALSRQIAVTARQLTADDPAAAVQLAIAGYRVAPTSDARSALLDLAAAGYPSRLPPVTGGSPSAATSHAGRRLAVVHNDVAVVRLYEVTTAFVPVGEVPFDAGPLDTGESHLVTLSPDGRLLAVREGPTDIGLWNVADPRRPARVGGLSAPGGMRELAIAPHGRELAVVGTGDDVHRWDIGDPATPRSLPGIPLSGRLNSLAYGPGGNVLAVGGDGARVELWALESVPRRLAGASAGEGRVLGVAFSPDGTTLAAGTALGRTVSVWRVGPDGLQRVQIGDPRFDSWVTRVTFSPDGTRLLAASAESVVRVWDATSWEPAIDLPHPNLVYWVGFGSGDVAVATTDDGAVWHWDLRTAVPTRMPGRAWRTAFSGTGQLAVFAEGAARVWADPAGDGIGLPRHAVVDTGGEKSIGDGDVTADGVRLVQSYVDGTIGVFDLPGQGAPRRLATIAADSVGIVESLALSPDGRVVASGGEDKIVRVHDISDPARPLLVAEMRGQTSKVLGVRWNLDGTRLAVGTSGGEIVLYDVSDLHAPNRTAVLKVSDNDVQLAEFSPDGTRLAAGGSLGVIHLWDVSDPTRPSPLGGPITGPVNVVPKLAFHPGGKLLGATDSKGALWLFDISDPVNPRRHATLTPGIGQMNSLAFHPSGGHLATASVPGVVRLWELDEEAVIAKVCTGVGEPITAEKWRTYLPDTEFRPPCQG